MGQENEHKNFLITAIKRTDTMITPSIEMNGHLIKRHNILEAHRISIVANEPNVFPEDPEENEIALKDEALWIYSRRAGLLDWRPLGGSGGVIVPDTIPAPSIIEDDDHNFVTNNQLLAIEEVVNGLIPAPKIVQDVDHQFLNQTQVDAVNDLVEGVSIDGGNLV